MDTLESGRELVTLEDQYHQIHRHALGIRARLALLGEAGQASQEELCLRQAQLAAAERDKRAILRAIEAIEDRLLD